MAALMTTRTSMMTAADVAAAATTSTTTFTFSFYLTSQLSWSYARAGLAAKGKPIETAAADFFIGQRPSWHPTKSVKAGRNFTP